MHFGIRGAPLDSLHVLQSVDMHEGESYKHLTKHFDLKMDSTSISDYRKFIFSLCEEISTNNLDSMKFLCRDILTTRELEAIENSATDFVVFLEQREELGSDNFDLLKDLLTQIKREDLVQKLKDFEMKQHRGTVRDNDDIPKNGSLVLNNNLEDYATDAKLPTPLPRSKIEDIQQVGFASRETEVMLRDVSADLYEKLGFLLNPASLRGSWIHLAGKLGYTNAHVANFKLEPTHSTQMLLEDWAQQDDATVLKLYQAVKAIGREDVAGELESILVPLCTAV